ncbi:antibiotic acetyltransferase [Solimonas sp. K1W22B-7]|uniref:CatB-related O-acetyltransferase n=1 Tax=Solimonas sp. K1W22B-7 TaxID=2303331 RepID=UPI000E331676|nr:CatB-related O-acetyltransferase [Solimonas sp. K1W22B-7]AXQ28360.1 antibiotic acetyltransferase [Solimonas sp. K1W22B-7]
MSAEAAKPADDSTLTSEQLLGLGMEAMGATGLYGVVDFERPCYLFAPRRVKNCTFGAFSYVNGMYTSSLYDTRVGRYCSIAEAAIVGPYEHPTDGLSTHTFAFSAPEDFPPFAVFQEFKDLATLRKRDDVNRDFTEIGHDVWIGAGAFIKRGVKIGDGAVVAAHALVTRDVPPYSIVVGTPAKVTRLRFSDDIVERLMKLQWWRYNLAPHKNELDYSRIEGALEGLEQRAAEGRLELLQPETWRLHKVRYQVRFKPERLPQPLYS